MKITALQTIAGPNYWSAANHNLIALQVDLDILEKYPTNKICGFYTRLRWLIPTLYGHKCSKCPPAGFLRSVKEGTSLAHVIGHIATELQCLAGMKTDFGQTLPTGKPGEYHVVFSYLEPNAGKLAANAAVNITNAILKDERYDLQKDIEALRHVYEQNQFGRRRLLPRVMQQQRSSFIS